MSMLGEVVVRLTAVTSGLKQALNDTKKQLTDLQSEIKKTSDGFDELATGLTAAGLVMGAGLGFAVVKFADFEKTMSRVQGLLGVTKSEMEELEQVAMSLGESTSFSAAEVAQGAQMLAQSGFSLEEIKDSIGGMLDVASAGQLDLATATEITADSLRAFQLDASQSAMLADVLAKTVTKSSQDMIDLKYALKQVSGEASSSGMSIQQVNAVLMTLSNNSIKGEMAGTALRGILASLKNPSKDAREELERLNIKMYDAQGRMVAFSNIIAQFEQATKSMTGAQKDYALAQIFGTEQISHFKTLLREGSAELVKFEGMLNNSSGAARELAEVSRDNLAGSWDEFTGALETMGISIGKAIAPMIRLVVDGLKAMISAFNGLSEETKKNIAIIATIMTVFTLLGATVAGFIAILPKLIAGIRAVGTALQFLALNPIGMVITAIGLLVGWAVYLLAKWGTTWNEITVLTGAACRYVVAFAENAMNSILSGLNKFKQWALGIISSVLNAVQPLVNTISSVIPGVDTFFNKAKTAIAGASAETSDKLVQLEKQSKFTSTQLAIAGEQVKRAWVNVKTPPKEVAQAVKEAGKSTVSTNNDVADSNKGVQNSWDAAGDSADEASKKAKKGAQDTRSEWEKAVDTLTTKLAILQATHQISNVQLGENAEQAKKLSNDLSYLRKEYDLQAQVVDKARIYFENMKRTKGEVSKEAAEAAQKYAQESKSLSDLSAKIAETNLALQQRKWVTDEARESLEILKAEHEKQVANLSLEAGKLTELQLKQTQLNETLDAQRVLISDLNHEYEMSRQVKGADAEETRKSYMALIKAQTEEAKLQRELRETSKAINDQTIEFNKLSVKVEELAKKYKDELSKAQTEYANKVTETNRKLADEERKLTENYERELDNRTKALRDFVGLFDAVQRKDVSGSDLLGNLRGQVDAMKDFDTSIGALAGRGVSEGLLEELKAMGPKAVSEIEALSNMSDVELTEYTRLWEEKSQWARRRATEELQGLKIETQQKIAELRQNAAEQLEQYRLEWQKKTSEIKTNTAKDMASIVENARKSGGDMVSTFIEGVRSRFSDLRAVMEEMAATVDAYMPHSPAKVGPLSRLDETGVGLIEVFSQGIKKSIPQLEAVTGQMASLVANKLPGVGAYDPRGNVGSNGNSFQISIHGGDSEEIMDKLERKLKQWGLI